MGELAEPWATRVSAPVHDPCIGKIGAVFEALLVAAPADRLLVVPSPYYGARTVVLLAFRALHPSPLIPHLSVVHGYLPC